MTTIFKINNINTYTSLGIIALSQSWVKLTSGIRQWWRGMSAKKMLEKVIIPHDVGTMLTQSRKKLKIKKLPGSVPTDPEMLSCLRNPSLFLSLCTCTSVKDFSWENGFTSVLQFWESLERRRRRKRKRLSTVFTVHSCQ